MACTSDDITCAIRALTAAVEAASRTSFVDLLTAFGTVAAVLVSVFVAVASGVSARRARQQRYAADARARKAEEDARAAVARARQELAEQEERRRQREFARELADRQAIRIRVTGHGVVTQTDREDGSPGKLIAWLRQSIENESRQDIRDMVLEVYAEGSAAPLAEIEYASPSSGGTVPIALPDGAAAEGSLLQCGLRFTDIDGSRWRLLPGGALYLLTPRVIDVAPG